jgi:RHS repeat-associated protein
VNFSYNPLGNITNKSNVGTYTFPPAGSAHPHAIASIANVPALGGGSTNFTYDNDGQLTAEAGTISRTVAWTLFHKPASVTYAGLTLNYQYDADGNRVMRTGPASGTIIYLPDGHAFFHTGADRSTWQWTSYYEAEGQKLVTTGGQTGALTHHYLHNDHQGSVLMVTDDTFNPSTGAPLLQDLGYDAYGQPRNLNSSPDPNWGSSAVSDRGYVNQEQITDQKLLDLNARLYDPEIGQLLSPDPIIDDQSDSQAWNAYAYARDNPMSDEDPTGLSCTGTIDCQYVDPGTGTKIAGETDDTQPISIENWGHGAGPGSSPPSESGGSSSGSTTYQGTTETTTITGTIPTYTSQLPGISFGNGYAVPGERGTEGITVIGYRSKLVSAASGSAIGLIFTRYIGPILSLIRDGASRARIWRKLAAYSEIGAGAVLTDASIASILPTDGVSLIGIDAGDSIIAAGVEGLTAAESAGGDFTTLYHGTDAESASNILSGGFDLGQAAEVGDGDELFTSTSAEYSAYFAQANPAGGEPALLQIRVPNSTIETLLGNNSLSIEGSVFRFQPGAIDTLNNSSTITQVPLP